MERNAPGHADTGAMAVSNDCQQWLSATVVNNGCQQWLSAMVVGNGYQQWWLSAMVVSNDCQQWLSAMVVSNGCQQWLSAMVVNNGCQQWLSAMAVSNAAVLAVLFSRQKRPFLRVLAQTDVTMRTSAKKRFGWSNFQLKRSYFRENGARPRSTGC